MATEDGCTPDDGQFVVAAFELSLAYLFADNCGEALTLGQKVDVFEQEALGLLEWLSPVSPLRLSGGR